MYAIANISGKQYKVEAGQSLLVDRLNAEVGAELSFPVMMTVDGAKVKTGAPVIKDLSVKVKVEAHVQDKKVVVYKYKAKKNERKVQGHRQPYSKITVLSID